MTLELDQLPETHAVPLAPVPHVRIRPPAGFASLRLADLWHYRDLLLALAMRDVKLRYKQTALGVIWVVLQPLMAAGAFSFVFGMVAKLPSDGKPYFLFSYAGLLGWNLFNNIVSKSSICLIGNSQLISKIFFPRLVLPASTVPSAMIDFGVAIVMMAALMLVYRVFPTPALLLLPVWIGAVLLLALGIGLISSALTVSYRDVQFILPVFLQILLYASPIAYSLSNVPGNLRNVYLLNPLSGLLEAFRWSLLGTARPPLPFLALALVEAVVVFVVGAYSFKRMERKFADVI